jgi:hypothetical protein
MATRQALGLLLFSLIVLLPSSAIAQGKKVTVYSYDFSGSSEEFGVGRYTNSDLIRANSGTVRSLKVPPGLKVTLYEKANFDGYSLVVTDNADLAFLKSKKFGEVTMSVSMVVEEYTPPAGMLFVTIFQDDFAGPSKSLSVGQYEHNELGPVGNDQLSSIKIPKGLKVTLYEHGGFGGRKWELQKDTRAGTFVNNGFNDITSSIEIEELPPAPAPVVPTTVVTTPTQTPVTTPAAPVTPTIAPTPAMPATPPEPVIYQGDFSGNFKSLSAGRYASDQLGIGNDQLSSIQVPRGFKVTLYEDDAFEGRSLVIAQDQRATFFAEKNFNNVTSSIVVEKIPMVTLFAGNYDGGSALLDVGNYRENQLGVGSRQLSSIRIPSGFRVSLYTRDAFEGRKWVLTGDANTEDFVENGFDNLTRSIVIEQIETAPAPRITIFDGDFTGSSMQLTAGIYEPQQLGIGNNTLSSIRIPRGLQVTLYEFGAMEGRSMVLRADAGLDFLQKNNFDNIVSSLKIEQLPPGSLYVTLVGSGMSNDFPPGRYNASESTVLSNGPLRFAKVPSGMRAIIYTDTDFRGSSIILEKDEDFFNANFVNGQKYSLIVEDKFQPSITPVKQSEVERPVEMVPVTAIPATTIVVPACEMNGQQLQSAIDAMDDKPFREDKMDMAKIVTKGKCLTNEQIRSLATRFSFEDQTLEFVKYAYDLSTEKSEYYTLNDIFKFLSSKSDFMAFLKSK